MGHEGERTNCFSKIQLVGQKYQDKTTLASKLDVNPFLPPKSRCFSLLVGYNIIIEVVVNGKIRDSPRRRDPS